MASLFLAACLIAYLPGALMFRLPLGDRARRAALDAEERTFWHVLISLAWSLSIVLILAVLDGYRFERLLFANTGLCLIAAAAGRARLLYRGRATGVTWTALLPGAIVILGLVQFFPPAEFVIGGQDPGVYVNEGVQLAQRGGIVTRDPVVAGIPAALRDLFIARNVEPEATYYGLRFMGFFIQDPDAGDVIGQFPHLYPASMAVGYGLNGLSGVRQTTGVWAILGLLAVYFAGTRLVGRLAAFSAAGLLGVHVMLAWYARYPNAEVVMMTLVFGATLAFARAHQDDNPFFAPVAGVLTALLIFLRSDALMVVVGLSAAMLLTWLVRDKRPRWGFVLPLLLGLTLGSWYLTGPMGGYLELPQRWLGALPLTNIAAALVAAVVGALLVRQFRRRLEAAGQPGHRLDVAVSGTFVAVLLSAAAYAWFIRQAEWGSLTDYDADALRDFTSFYLSWPALVAALVGLVLVARHGFWRDPAIFLIFGGFSLFFFYKIRIVPNHFWASRRFLPVILPMALLLVATTAVGAWRTKRGTARIHRLRIAVGLALVLALGTQYARASAPVLQHVEYAGVIPYLEQLAARFDERDLIIVEGRNASDMHVLALPLAYIYARQVLVLDSPTPDKVRFQAFLTDALQRYDRVFFMGGGGTDLLSREIQARSVGGDTVQVPEYDSPWNAYPERPRQKEFDYSIYELSVGQTPPGPFILDVGFEDDLNVLRFHAKERSQDRTVRWTGAQSFVAVSNLSGSEREVMLVLHDGGRPATAPAATVEVFLGDEPLGTLDVTGDFRAYVLPLPAAAAERAALESSPLRLRLLSTTWVPQTLVGGPDTRELGVMVDRVEIR